MQVDTIKSTQEFINKNNIEHLQRNNAEPDEQFQLKKDIIDETKNIPKDSVIEKSQIADALEKMSRTIEIFNKRLKFYIDDNSKRVVVKVIDSKTNQVIREIPPKEMLKFVANLHKFLGVFIDTKR